MKLGRVEWWEGKKGTYNMDSLSTKNSVVLVPITEIVNKLKMWRRDLVEAIL